MREITKKHLTRRRLISLFTMFIMLFNLFSPYSALAANTSAESVPTGKPYITIKAHTDFLNPDDAEIWERGNEDSYLYYLNYLYGNTSTPEEGPHLVTIDVMVNGPITTLSEIRLNLIYDDSILTPTTYVDRGRNHYYEPSDDPDDFIDTKWGATLNQANNEIALTGSSDPGTYLATNTKYVSFTFLLNEGHTLDELTQGAFSLGFNESEGTGLRMIWETPGVGTGIDYVDGDDYLVYDGFASSSSSNKTVTGITLNSGLTKTKYYNGEALDLTGVSITVTYDNNASDTETFDTVDKINQAIADGIISISSTSADSTKTATISSGEVNCANNLTYSVATGISYNNNMTTTSYNHGDTIVYTGGSITITYDNDSSNTATLGIQDGIDANLLTSDHATADVDSPTVTLTYVDNVLTAPINLTVRDYITNITVVTNPTKTTYEQNEGIELDGGVMNVTWKSGKVENNLSMKAEGKGITAYPTQAKISYCETPTWKNGELDAGTQKVWVVYGEDSAGDPYKAPLQNVTVNDTVASIEVASQPTNAKNKHGMTSAQLNLEATAISIGGGRTSDPVAQLKVTTAGEATVYVNITPSMLDSLSYDSTNITNEQNIPVSYGGISTATGQGIKIKLKNYITGITVTAPNNLSAVYDTDYDLSGVTYVKNYACGPSSEPINVKDNTKVTVTGYNKKPAANTFNSSHESPQTVKVTLTTVDDVNVDETGKFDTFTVKVLDKVTGIRLAQAVNNRTYDYGGTLSLAGGKIGFTYASGATSSTTLALTDSKVTVTELDGSTVNMSPDKNEFTNGKCTKQLKITYVDDNSSPPPDTTSLSIIIKDVLSTMAIATQPTKAFNHGDTFTVGSGTALLTYESGATATIDLDDGTTITETVATTSVNMSPESTEYTNNSLTKNVTVEYSQATQSRGTITKSVNYDITLTNNMKSIAMKNNPTKTTYNVGDTEYDLKNTAGKNEKADLEVTYQANNKETIALNETGVSLTPLNTLTTSEGDNKTVTVTYGTDKDGTPLTTNFKINVITKKVSSIAVTTEPDKKAYIEGETVDLSGMVVTATYNDGTSSPITNYTTTPASGAQITTGNTTMTITYAGTDFVGSTAPTTSQALTITPRTVTSITATNATKMSYIEGEAFDPTGMTITINYDAGDPVTITNNYAAAGITFSPSGDLAKIDTTITIGYTGTAVTTTKTITIADKKVTGIVVKTPPSNVNYTVGQTFSTSGLVVEATYNNGKTIQTTDYTTSPANGDTLAKTDTTVTITYTGTDYNTATAPTTTQTIVIADRKVSSIAVTNAPTKASYVEGETLSLAGMVVTATYDNGTYADVTNYTTSPADGAQLTLGNTSITITYAGTDFVGSTAPATSQTLTITPRTVTSITATDATKMDYIEGEAFDPTGMTITINYDAGDPVTITNNYAAAGITFSPSGDLAKIDTTITISYTGTSETATKTITIADKKVTGIAVKTPPSNVNYTVGQNFSTSGLVVEATYNNGKTIPTTDYTTSPANGDTLAKTDTTVTITYTGTDYNTATAPTTTQTIVIADRKVSSIAVTNAPTKASYIEGETLSLAGMVVTATYDNTTTDVITNYTTSPADGAQLTTGNTSVTITYAGTDYVGSTAPATSQALTITPRTVTSITATDATKMDYIEGEAFDPTGMTITVYYNSGDPVTITNNYAAAGVTFSPSGDLAKTDTSITVSYGGESVNKVITIADKKVTGIVVKTPPSNVNYTVGQNFSTVGLVVEATYNNGKTIPTTDYTTSPADGDALTASDTTVTITYSGTDYNTATAPTTTQTIVIGERKVSSIAVTTPPTKASYIEGETLSLAGMVVTATYNNGTHADVTSYTTSPADGAQLTLGNTTVTITYGGTDYVGSTAPATSQTLTIAPRTVTSITATDATKMSYVAGESFNPAGMTITVNYNTGDPLEITSDYATAGVTFTPSGALGTTDTAIRVSYGGKWVDKPITVAEKKVNTITVTPPTKTSYIVGENVDLSGMVVTAHYNDGTSDSISSYTTSIANGTELGSSDTSITITYSGTDYSGSVAPTTTQTLTIAPRKVDSISITPPTKTSYVAGQNLSLSGMVVTVHYNNGKTDTTNNYTTSIADGTALTTSDTVITITYSGTDYSGSSAPTETQAISVVPKLVEAIAITMPPTKTSYIEGENLNLSGMVVTVTYNDGTSTPTSSYTASPADGDALTSASTVITVTYNGTDYSTVDAPTTTQNITVTARQVDNIVITTPPTETTYIEGQSFDPTGMVITVNYTTGDPLIISSDYATKGVTFTPNGALATSNTSIQVAYRGETANQAITVNQDTVTDITLTIPSTLNKTYDYGSGIDLTGATLTKVWASGIAHTDDTIAITKDMLSNADISNFDNMNSLGTKQIDVTYAGVTKTNAFQVTIQDYVDGIEIEDKSKLQTEYIYGDTINVKDKDTGADLYILIKYAGGSPDERELLTTSMLSGFSMTTVQDGQTVTVTHLGQRDTYQINVKDQITGITVSKKPAKKVYNLGETAVFSDIVVKNVMKSGLEGATLTASEYTLSTLDSSSTGEKTITVTKAGTSFTDTFKVKVIDATTDMYISALPKQDYLYGESLDISAGQITVKTQTTPDGTSTPMTDPSVSVTGYSPKTLGNQTLTVTYKYTELDETGVEQAKTKADTYTVTVTDYWAGKIEAIAPTKQKYKYGEKLDLTGAKVGKVMASGAKENKVDVTGEMIQGYDSTKVGTQNVTVVYEGKTTTFSVTVTDETLGISMNTTPTKTEYKKGAKIDLTGATINVTKLSGTSIASITPNMISGYNPNKTGVQVITVSYDGQETEFTIEVKASQTNTNKPSSKPVSSKPIASKPIVDTPVVETPTPEIPTIESPEPPVQETESVQTPSTQQASEKPTVTLGVKDKNNKKTETVKQVAGSVSAFGLLELLILMILKRNTNVYVYEAGKFVLGGRCRLSKSHPALDIDKFLDDDNYQNKVRIRLNDEISQALDGREIEIKHRGKKIKHKIKYNQCEHVITLE